MTYGYLAIVMGLLGAFISKGNGPLEIEGITPVSGFEDFSGYGLCPHSEPGNMIAIENVAIQNLSYKIGALLSGQKSGVFCSDEVSSKTYGNCLLVVSFGRMLIPVCAANSSLIVT
jgi:hypothetical protein